MMDVDGQRDHYDRLMEQHSPTKGLSCGYEDRFDPFLLDRRPELFGEFDRLFREIFPEPPERLLDIGCGSGIYFPALAPRAKQIIGIDISQGMVTAAQKLIDEKKLENIELRIGSALDLKFGDEEFDAILAFDVLHHLPNAKQALLEARRVLKPGGIFVSIEPNVLNPIVFIAHAMPREERGALRTNYPWYIGKTIKKVIGSPKSKYVNHVTASNNRILLGGIRLVNVITRIWPFRYFSIRMVWTAKKR